MADGDSVTQKQFYETMNNVKGEVISKIDGLKVDISDLGREMGEIKTTGKANADNIERNCDQIEEIQKQQRGFAAIASMIGGAIGAASAVVLKIFGNE